MARHNLLLFLKTSRQCLQLFKKTLEKFIWIWIKASQHSENAENSIQTSIIYRFSIKKSFHFELCEKQKKHRKQYYWWFWIYHSLSFSLIIMDSKLTRYSLQVKHMFLRMTSQIKRIGDDVVSKNLWYCETMSQNYTKITILTTISSFSFLRMDNALKFCNKLSSFWMRWRIDQTLCNSCKTGLKASHYTNFCFSYGIFLKTESLNWSIPLLVERV